MEQRRADTGLCIFYKIIHGIVAVPLPDHVQYRGKLCRGQYRGQYSETLQTLNLQTN